MKRYIAPVAIGVVGVAILLSLANWQIHRLTWKQGILDEISAMMAHEPAPVWQAVEPNYQRYAPVVMDGVAGDRELHVLVSHKQLGPGYRIVTSFATEGRTLMLDQGFVADEDRDKARSVLAGRVSGNLHLPEDRSSSTPENDVAGNIWFARDLDQMAVELEVEPVLVVLRDADGLDPMVTPLPLDTAAIPNDHMQYAITWFSLALVWSGMTLFWLWRIRRRTI